MRLGDQLSKEQKQQLNKMAVSNKKQSHKKKTEQLSQRDWEELMGMNRDTYIRRNGAVRRK